MGASGSSALKPRKRKGLRPQVFLDVPHPRFVRVGQRFFPIKLRRGASRYALTIVKLLDDGQACVAKLDDIDGKVVRPSVRRLLAIDGEGAARHYRFLGYVGGKRYRTHACVMDTDDAWARLVCPEWHPGLVVTVGVSEVPWVRREPGTWLECEVDLGAPTAAQLQLSRVTAKEITIEPERYAPIDQSLLSTVGCRDEPTLVPAVGEGCGDVVLFASDRRLQDARAGGVYVNGFPPPVEPGGRLYLHSDGRVRAWREVESVLHRPNGVRVTLQGLWHDVDVPVIIERPATGLAGGAMGRQEWVWRSWGRDEELYS